MTDKPVSSQCGACFGTRINVVEERFAAAAEAEAFERFADLFRQGRAPQLCQDSRGNYCVCHLVSRVTIQAD